MDLSKKDLSALEAYLSVTGNAARLRETVRSFMSSVRGFKGVPIPKAVIKHLLMNVAPQVLLGGKPVGIDPAALARSSAAADSPVCQRFFESLVEAK